MPIPQALAARLAKRGLIKATDHQNFTETQSSEQEEIIAEDYDDTAEPDEPELEPAPPEMFDKFQGWYTCPNKWNVYHECTPACQEYWKRPQPLDEEYSEKRTKLLQKYPLASHWKEILDVGIKRYYYWNTETQLVSWFPPGHKKCRVSLSAAQLRKEMAMDREERMEDESDNSDEDLSKDKKDETDESSESEPEETVTSRKNKYDSKTREDVDMRRKRDVDMRRRRVDDILDPMDPAAYSECPRGTWASGLPDKTDAKTGVDSTASGPLFQMRPYPNPGSILKTNAESIGPKKPSG